jgi:hypothetical protein
MYLLELDENTNLILDDPATDSWKGIKDFTELVKKHKIEGLTVVAFSVDYLSPFKHYIEKDRFYRAQEEVYGKREKLKADDPLIVNAIRKYKMLQFHPDIEHEHILKENKIRLLKNYSAAVAEEDDVKIEKTNRAIQQHETSSKQFYDRYDKKVAISSAVSSKDYELSRIERDILSRKNSKFVEHDKKIENPNKLNLT